MDEDKFNKWYDKNEAKLIENWNNDNLDLGLLDDDMPDIPQRGDFQEWTEEEYIRVMKGGWEAKNSKFKDMSKGFSKYFKTRPEAERYAKNFKRSLGGYYRVEANENLTTHRCGRLINPDEGCGMCEKIKYDADQDNYE